MGLEDDFSKPTCIVSACMPVYEAGKDAMSCKKAEDKMGLIGAGGCKKSELKHRGGKVQQVFRELGFCIFFWCEECGWERRGVSWEGGLGQTCAQISHRLG